MVESLSVALELRFNSLLFYVHDEQIQWQAHPPPILPRSSEANFPGFDSQINQDSCHESHWTWSSGYSSPQSTASCPLFCPLISLVQKQIPVHYFRQKVKNKFKSGSLGLVGPPFQPNSCCGSSYFPKKNLNSLIDSKFFLSLLSS